MVKFYYKLKSYLFLPLIALIFIILAFVFDDVDTILNGMQKIYTSKSILMTDYMELAGIGATLINVASRIILNLLIVKYLKIKISGPLYAAMFVAIGFSFFGENLYNILPIYIGAIIYSKYINVKPRRLFTIAMFATGLAPVVSYLSFGVEGPLYLCMACGIFVGLIIGFVVPILSKQFIKFHQGYNLYNIGFSIGIFAILLNALFKNFEIYIESENLISSKYSLHLYIIFGSISLFYTIVGFVHSKLKRFKKLLNEPGRGLNNFHVLYGSDLSMFNMGLLGLMGLSVMAIFKIELSGPIMAGLFTLLGFGMFGKTVKNASVLMLGGIIGTLMFNHGINNDPSSIGFVMAILFVTALAPIAGDFGIIIGLLTGILHIAVATQLAGIQGYLNLYNNGLAAGFVAAVVSYIVDGLKEDRHGT